MGEKTTYQLREEIQGVLEKRMRELARQWPDAVGREEGHVIVTVTPYNDIAIMVISPLFEGRNPDQRDELVWPVLNETLNTHELELLTRWELMSVAEARLVYPSLLKRRQPEVATA